MGLQAIVPVVPSASAPSYPTAEENRAAHEGCVPVDGIDVDGKFAALDDMAERRLAKDTAVIIIRKFWHYIY